MDLDKTLIAKIIIGVIFAQLTPDDQTKHSFYFKEGVKVLGEETIKTIVDEAKQLDEK